MSERQWGWIILEDALRTCQGMAGLLSRGGIADMLKLGQGKGTQVSSTITVEYPE